ncbi:hypothetical protein [Sebaldella sp. S0638]|uniref:hypothetical protein n=1 Tax=Sebaldella sp. S0638 TaxID=2957809 RepID=UPI0020A001B1|nr:hypothetical protein [Sebaldella sp. S0638]MCP1223393.1 hypothetical protein [Sebaldella sp. S0638]
MKEALISVYSLVEYAGSEINSLQIAQELKKKGFKVTIFTFSYGYPMKNLFVDEDIEIIDFFESRINFENKEFDLLWCHHSPTLYSLIYNLGIRAKKIIFQSLSPFMDLEVIPFFYEHISLILTNSLETKNQIISDLKINELRTKITVFQNFVPDSYFQVKKDEYILKKIAIISNHLCDEIKDVSELFIKDGLKVDIIGKEKKVKFVDRELLSNYDLVITIGKTVQYCFSSSIPVYCYDYFGGPGYITKENLEKAESLNFSGRGFNNLTQYEIYKDIIENYNKNIENIDFYHEYAKEKFSLSKNIDEILKYLTELKEVNIDILKKEYSLIEKHNNYFLNELKNNLYYKKKNNFWDIETRLFFKINDEWIEQVDKKSSVFYENNILKVKYVFKQFQKTDEILLNPIINKFIKCKIYSIIINDEKVNYTNSNMLKKDEFDYFISVFPFYEIKFDKVMEVKEMFFEVEIVLLNEYEIAGMAENLISNYKKDSEEKNNIIKYNEYLIKEKTQENNELKRQLNFILESKYWKIRRTIKAAANILRRK